MASLSAILLGKMSKLIWLKRRPLFPKTYAISCVLFIMSVMELETRNMLSTHTRISNGIHSGAQDTAGARPTHNCNNSSINTAITWFQPESVLGPPCLMPSSKLNEALFVNPKHGRARSFRFFSLLSPQRWWWRLFPEAHLPTWALTESNALATSMETTNNFSPHSSALRKLSTKKETMSRTCLPGLNPNN